MASEHSNRTVVAGIAAWACEGGVRELSAAAGGLLLTWWCLAWLHGQRLPGVDAHVLV